MLFTTYKHLMILYKPNQRALLKNIIKQYSNDLQALKQALNDNSIEAY